jgi:galacturan 1,4-alpha-galacturonidase
MAPLSFAKIAFLLVSAVTSVVGLTCEVSGDTSDNGPAIKAALTQCNNGGTTSKSYPFVHGYY